MRIYTGPPWGPTCRAAPRERRGRDIKGFGRSMVVTRTSRTTSCWTAKGMDNFAHGVVGVIGMGRDNPGYCCSLALLLACLRARQHICTRTDNSIHASR